MSYQQKYLKYKSKYLELKKQLGGDPPPIWTNIFDLISDAHINYCKNNQNKSQTICDYNMDKIKIFSQDIATKLPNLIAMQINAGKVTFTDNNINIDINEGKATIRYNIGNNIDNNIDNNTAQYIPIINPIIKSITYEKDGNTPRCNSPKDDVACGITDEDKERISSFLAHVIPQCEKADIKLEDIKAGKILGKGAFGYSYRTKRNNKPHKVIKINIYSETKQHILEAEKTIHMQLTKAQQKEQTKFFVDLIGYFFHENNKYTYIYLDNDGKETKVCDITDKPGKELYTIMEAGQGDLFDIGYQENPPDINKIIEEVIKILNFYKISNKFCNKNEFLKHRDIKLENLILMNDNTIKIIDFGLSKISNYFFIKDNAGTPEYLYMAFGNSIFHTSPLYDIFCVIYALFIYINQSYIYNEGEENRGYNVAYDKINEGIKYNKSFDKNMQNKLKQLNLLAYHIYLYHSKKFSRNKIYENVSNAIFNDFHTLLKDIKPPCKDVKYPTTGSDGCRQMKYLEAIVNSYLTSDLFPELFPKLTRLI